jgi:hypothetical protein
MARLCARRNLVGAEIGGRSGRQPTWRPLLAVMP